MGDTFSTSRFELRRLGSTHADRKRRPRAETEGRPLRETTLSRSANGAFVESSLSAIKAHEDAEEASIAERLGATGIEYSERDRPEVSLPASVIDWLETDVLLVDTIADVELHSVNADDAIVLGTLDPKVRGILELG